MTTPHGQDKTLAVLAKIATEFSVLNVSLPEFLSRAVKVLGQELGFDHCVVALIDERGTGRLVARAASGLAAPRLGTAVPPGAYARVMETGEAALIGDLRAAADPPDPDFRSCISAPILVHGRAVGLVNAYQPDPGRFTAQDLNLIVIVARYFSSAIELGRLYEQPASGAKPGYGSEPTFREALARELRRGQRHEEPLALLCLDVDDFEAIRETYGAALADTLLGNMARLLGGMLRESDTVALGSSGFLLLLPNTPKRAGLSVAERIRQRARGVIAAGGPPVTVSVGVAVWPQDGATAETLLTAAKDALENARRQGGDHVQPSRAAP